MTNMEEDPRPQDIVDNDRKCAEKMDQEQPTFDWAAKGVAKSKDRS